MRSSHITTVRPALLFVRLLPLLAALALTLFPFGWLAEVWPPFERLLDTIGTTVLHHAVGHIAIFVTLGTVVLLLFPALRNHFWRYTALMLLAAVAQESFQLLYKQRALVFDDFRDLVTDSVGFVVAFIVVRLWSRRRNLRSTTND